MAVYASVAANPDSAPTSASPARAVQVTFTPAGKPSRVITGTRINAVNNPRPSLACTGTFFRLRTGLVASTASTRVAISKNASTAPIGSGSVYGTSAGEHRQGVERTDHVAHERGGHPRPE